MGSAPATPLTHGWQTAKLVCRIALCHLLASRWKTLIVGSVGGSAAFLIVVGSSILSSVDDAMRRGITDSLAGDIQVYSSESKDAFEILGDAFVEVPDLAPLDDFSKLRATLLAVPNVAAVVPMGFSNGTVSSNSALDRALNDLRATSAALGQRENAELLARYEMQQARVRQMFRVRDSEERAAQQVSVATTDAEAQRDLARAASDAFWADFDSAPLENLDFLENRVAPHAAAPDTLPLRFVGTDPAAFAKAFKRLRIVDGAAIPSGERGFLFAKRVYEEQIKLRAAAGLDAIKRARDERRRSIATDPELQRIVAENVGAVSEIVLQLDEDIARSFLQELRALLGSQEDSVAKLLTSFFETSDGNFDERFAFFYRVLAPRLSLYRYGIGDVLTVQTSNRNGYVRSANVKVYGTYTFDGLEQSPQAGAVNMMDLVTFRDLYGFGTPEQEQERLAMHASAGVKDVDRDNVENVLFADKEAPEAAAAVRRDANAVDPIQLLSGTRARSATQSDGSYDPRLAEQGAVLNVAVRLADEGKTAETLEAIRTAGRNASLPLNVISGADSAGLLGQFVNLMRGVLLAAVLVIFVVTLVVVNNALMMATMDRVPEIGALRAIGARRSFVFALLAFESMALGLVAGSLGTAFGKAVVVVLGRVGIPAGSDVLDVLFSGRRLFPVGTAGQLWLALATVVMVSAFSGVYPAWVATRVSPRQAMSAEE